MFSRLLVLAAAFCSGSWMAACAYASGEEFPWTPEIARAVGQVLAVTPETASEDEALADAGGVAAGVAPAAAGRLPAAPSRGFRSRGLGIANAASGGSDNLLAEVGMLSPIPADVGGLNNSGNKKAGWNADMLPTQVNSLGQISSLPTRQSAPLTVNSPKPFSLPNPYGDILTVAGPTTELLNGTALKGPRFTQFTNAVGTLGPGMTTYAIWTDVQNISKSNDPAHLWQLGGNTINLVTGYPADLLAQAGTQMRTDFINERTNMEIQAEFGPGTNIPMLTNNQLDFPTRFVSKNTFDATIIGSYNDGFTSMQSTLYMTKTRKEEYSNWLHFGDWANTEILTSKQGFTRTTQGIYSTPHTYQGYQPLAKQIKPVGPPLGTSYSPPVNTAGTGNK